MLDIDIVNLYSRFSAFLNHFLWNGMAYLGQHQQPGNTSITDIIVYQVAVLRFTSRPRGRCPFAYHQVYDKPMFACISRQDCFLGDGINIPSG